MFNELLTIWRGAEFILPEFASNRRIENPRLEQSGIEVSYHIAEFTRDCICPLELRLPKFFAVKFACGVVYTCAAFIETRQLNNER
jgi:hypothetical protein